MYKKETIGVPVTSNSPHKLNSDTSSDEENALPTPKSLYDTLHCPTIKISDRYMLDIKRHQNSIRKIPVVVFEKYGNTDYRKRLVLLKDDFENVCIAFNEILEEYNNSQRNDTVMKYDKDIVLDGSDRRHYNNILKVGTMAIYKSDITSREDREKEENDKKKKQEENKCVTMTLMYVIGI